MAGLNSQEAIWLKSANSTDSVCGGTVDTLGATAEDLEARAAISRHHRAHRLRGEGIYFLSLTTYDWTSAGVPGMESGGLLPRMRSKMSVLMA